MIFFPLNRQLCVFCFALLCFPPSFSMKNGNSSGYSRPCIAWYFSFFIGFYAQSSNSKWRVWRNSYSFLFLKRTSYPMKENTQKDVLVSYILIAFLQHAILKSNPTQYGKLKHFFLSIVLILT